MKKVILLTLVSLLFFNITVLAKEAQGRWFTKGRPNGLFVVENYDDKPKGFQLVGDYTSGVIDCAFALKPELMKEYYADSFRVDIMDKMANYYKNNPDKTERQVVDVILSGCK